MEAVHDPVFDSTSALTRAVWFEGEYELRPGTHMMPFSCSQL